MTVAPLALPGPGAAAGGRTARVRRGAVLCRALQAVRPDLPLTTRMRRIGRDLPAAGRVAAGHRAGRGTGHGLAAACACLRVCERRLRLLTGGAHDQPARLRAMRAAIAWSYELLSVGRAVSVPPARRLRWRLHAGRRRSRRSGRRIAVPWRSSPRWWTTACCSRRPRAGEPRFVMLETIREYALEQLEESGEEIDARRAHAAYYRAREEAGPRAAGPLQQQWRDRAGVGPGRYSGRVGVDPRVRPPHPVDADNGLLMVGSLWYFWFQRGLTGEARRLLRQALAAAPSRGRPRAQALLGAGTLAWRQGDCATARDHLDESVRPVARIRRRASPGGAERCTSWDTSASTNGITGRRGLFEESLADLPASGRQIGGLPLIGDLGLVAYHESDFERLPKRFFTIVSCSTAFTV